MIFSFLVSFVIASIIIIFVPAHLKSAPASVKGTVELVRVSWDVVTRQFSEQIEAFKEGRLLQHVDDQMSVVRSSTRLDLAEFFENASRHNFLGIGALFSINQPVRVTKRSQNSENAAERSDQQGLTRMVMFKEVRQFEGDELAYYRVIENDQVVVREFSAEGPTILHGALAQMRADGVNEVFVRFVEEEINVVNYYLEKVRQDELSGNLVTSLFPWACSPVFFGHNILAGLVQAVVTPE